MTAARTNSLQIRTSKPQALLPRASLSVLKLEAPLVPALTKLGAGSGLKENCCHSDSPVISFSPGAARAAQLKEITELWHFGQRLKPPRRITRGAAGSLLPLKALSCAGALLAPRAMPAM